MIYRFLDLIWLAFTMWVIWVSDWEYQAIASYVTFVICAYYLMGMCICDLHKKMNRELDEIGKILDEIKQS